MQGREERQFDFNLGRSCRCQASEAENGSEAAESASTSQAATAEESKYPQYYIDMSGVNWNHWTLHKERDLSYFEKTPKDISILNNDFDFDDRGNLVLTIAYEDDNRENCNGSVGCKYTYNSDGTIKRADFTDGYTTSESYEYDSRSACQDGFREPRQGV